MNFPLSSRHTNIASCIIFIFFLGGCATSELVDQHATLPSNLKNYQLFNHNSRYVYAESKGEADSVASIIDEAAEQFTRRSGIIPSKLVLIAYTADRAGRHSDEQIEQAHDQLKQIETISLKTSKQDEEAYDDLTETIGLSEEELLQYLTDLDPSETELLFLGNGFTCD